MDCQRNISELHPVALTKDHGVIKTILKHAKLDALSPSGHLPLVQVHYEGKLAKTGEVFDTTRIDNVAFQFELGSGSVIEAWEVALTTMKVGEIARIECAPGYAYGSKGCLPDIPANSTLVFEVELVDCKPRKGCSSMCNVADEKARLEELKKKREHSATVKEEESKKREEAKSAAAARIQAKLDAKRGLGKGKRKSK